MTVKGYVRDREPNKKEPSLELYFDFNSALPQGDREPIVLDLYGTCWEGTINSVNPTNRPFVHTFLTRGSTRTRCNEEFLKLGLAENAVLHFELEGNTFRLLRIVDKGRWRPGNAPHER